jgi:ribosome modulation factor
MDKQLKLELSEIKQQQKQDAELADCYELGKRAAWDGLSVDDCPRYRKQNKVSAWLKGFTDIEHEKQNKALQGNVNKQGIIKLKQVISQALK